MIAVSDATRRRQYADCNVMASVSKHHDQQAAPRVVVQPRINDRRGSKPKKCESHIGPQMPEAPHGPNNYRSPESSILLLQSRLTESTPADLLAKGSGYQRTEQESCGTCTRNRKPGSRERRVRE